MPVASYSSSTHPCAASFNLEHSGCDLQLPSGQALPCANISQVCRSTARSSPPYGDRFMYDTGGRTITKVGDVDLQACAMTCLLDGPMCRGFTLVGTEASSADARGVCYTVNDTEHRVGTRLESASYKLVRSAGKCRLNCGQGDGKAFAPAASDGGWRPVAALRGGLAQCQQECEIAEVMSPGSCAAIVHDGINSLCGLVNSTAAVVQAISPLKSYRRVPKAPPITMQRSASSGVLHWVVDATSHVFEAARPSQTLFCDKDVVGIDWAAAPGTFVAAQIALLLLPQDPDTAPRTHTVSASVSVSDLVSANGKNTIAAMDAITELSQVGLVYAKSCSPAQCGGRSYSAELTGFGGGGGDGWYPDLLQPLGSDGYPSTLTLRPNKTRAIYIGLRIPVGTSPGEYHGVVSIHFSEAAMMPANTVATTNIKLVVWPITASCLVNEIKAFGSAYGFDHEAVDQIWPGKPHMHAVVQQFTGSRHVGSSSLDLWQQNVSSTETEAAATTLLESQDLFLADSMYLTPTAAKYMESPPFNTTWFKDKMAALASRMNLVKTWGYENRSAVYGPDELPQSTEAGINFLFREVKRRWPSTSTMAVINWPAQAVLNTTDILIFQYQLLQNPLMEASRDAFVTAGKHVWGYHCVSPTASVYLNSFIDVPSTKSRLIPWLAASSNLTGWLYWYINYGWRHAPSATNNSTGKIEPLQPLEQSTGRSTYDTRVGNGNFWTNSDGNWMYAGLYGPLSSIRLEAYRMGLEDRALLALLNDNERASLSGRMVQSATNWTIDAMVLEKIRRDAAAMVGKRQC
jgi:hypothetical protein